MSLHSQPDLAIYVIAVLTLFSFRKHKKLMRAAPVLFFLFKPVVLDPFGGGGHMSDIPHIRCLKGHNIRKAEDR